jgi:PAP2 superfamily
VSNHFRTAGRVTRLVVLAVVSLCVGAGTAAADAITDWNNVVVSVTIAAGRSNPETAAAATYMHLAIYDAINSIDGRYQPFATRVAHAPAGASREAAAAEAAYRILAYLYPAATFPTLASQFAAAYTSALNAIPDGQAKTDGMAVGQAAAAGLLATRQNDGFRANVPYVFLPLAPGVYQKTPGPDGTIATYAGPVTPWMKQFRPFTLRSPDQFRADGPPRLGSRRWARDLNEVKAFGAASNLPNSRSAEQEEIGLFYGLINAQLQIFRNLQRLAKDQHPTDDIAESARFFAQVSVTITDAQIGCWESKYHFNFWRPVTAIQNADIDGNSATDQDVNWKPQIVTPGHPEYPSAHGCGTAAYANAIAEFFGTKRLPGGIWLSGAAGHPDRFFASTKDIVDEIIDARVYNGVHYRSSVVDGAALGRNVARWVAKFHFRPVARDDDRDDDHDDDGDDN